MILRTAFFFVLTQMTCLFSMCICIFSACYIPIDAIAGAGDVVVAAEGKGPLDDRGEYGGNRRRWGITVLQLWMVTRSPSSQTTSSRGKRTHMYHDIYIQINSSEPLFVVQSLSLSPFYQGALWMSIWLMIPVEVPGQLLPMGQVGSQR